MTKFFPLVWAGLWRKPARTILTLFSVIVAFMLFGLMTGLNAGFAYLETLEPANRIYVNGRFGGVMPLSERDQMARVDGVTKIGYFGFLGGYYRDPKNFAGTMMIDPEMQYAWPELPLTPQQFATLQADRTGVFMSRLMADRYGFKAGDTFPLQATQNAKADGSKLWTFTVLGIVNDIPGFPGGFILGNFDYFNEARSQKDSGTVAGYTVLIKDPARAAETSSAIDEMFANSGAPTRSVPAKVGTQSALDSVLNIGYVTGTVAAAGLFMILFMVGNSLAQSVRERIAEFAVMKVLGFSNAGVAAILLVEAAVPCLIGAAAGVALAAAIASQSAHLIPAGFTVPLPRMSFSVFAWAMVFAIAVAFASALFPAIRVMRFDVAAALSGR